jgi:methyltransferase
MNVLAEPVLGHAIVAAVALQRLSEVAIDRRNRRALAARGGVLVEHDATAALVAFHLCWFAGLVAERTLLGARMPSLGACLALGAALALVVAARAWVFATLGRRWTMRVVVVPGETPVRRGPYRFVAHPNYLVVCAEVLLVALLVGAVWTAVLGSVANAVVLSLRVQREEAAWRALGREPLDRAPPSGLSHAPSASRS